MGDGPVEPAKLDRPKGKDTQIREKDEKLLAEKDRQIAALTERAKDAEAGEDVAQTATVEAWKWSSNAWRNTFLGSWTIAAIVAGIFAGMSYLKIDIPGVGVLTLNVDKPDVVERAAPAVEAVNKGAERADSAAEEGP